MSNAERTVASVCGSVALEGTIVQKSIRDSITRCLRDEAIFDFAVTYVAGARASYRNMNRTETDPDDVLCYAGTHTLVNRLNIRDPEVLGNKIRDVSAIRLAEFERYPILEVPSLALLKRFHHGIYRDIFGWAGELRATESSDPLVCRCGFIEGSCESLMSELRDENYLSDLPKEEFSRKLAYYIGELHVIQPFRYGSDLTARAFAQHIAVMNGFYLDFSKTCRSLMDVALKFSLSDSRHLEQILSEIISDY